MAVSDVFIAKREQHKPMEWAVIEAFKVNYGYNMKFTVKAIINEKVNETLHIGEELQVKGDFAAMRRRHLDGIRVPCGLIVVVIFNFKQMWTIEEFNIEISVSFISMHIQKSTHILMIRITITLMYSQKAR